MIEPWMRACPECVRLWRQFDSLTPTLGRTAAIRNGLNTTVRSILAHVAQDHAGRLPARRADCTKCAEFARARNYGPHLVTPTIRAVIVRADSEHLAGHLWQLWDVEGPSAGTARAA